MSNALLSIACFLGAVGVAPAAGGPPQIYHAEVVIHQGPEKPGSTSVVSSPLMCLAEGQPGRVLIGQSVRLWGGRPTDVGMRAEALLRAGEGGLTLRMVIEYSEVVRDAEGDPQISTARMEFEKPVRLDAPLLVKPINVGEKTPWVDVRLKPTPK